MENESIPVESSLVPLRENPTHLMRQATDVAGVCKEIVVKTACNIQGKKYIKCEGWMAIATAHGCIASSREVEKIEGGFRAIGEIRRINDGVVLATAEGFVGRDEKRWAEANEYACRAMAQTRAISRACRAAFAHVVVLMDAGLSTTPFEEVPDEGFTQPAPSGRSGGSQGSAPAPATRPAPTQAAKPATKAADVLPKPAVEATEDQKARFIGLFPGTNADYALRFFQQKGWIANTPEAKLADLPLKHVPVTKKQADDLLAQVEAFATQPTSGHAEEGQEWREFVFPWGKDKGIKLGDFEKNRLYGFVMNFEPTEEYNGQRKSDEAIAVDRELRRMLNMAGVHYDWIKSEEIEEDPF